MKSKKWCYIGVVFVFFLKTFKAWSSFSFFSIFIYLQIKRALPIKHPLPHFTLGLLEWNGTWCNTATFSSKTEIKMSSNLICHISSIQWKLRFAWFWYKWMSFKNTSHSYKYFSFAPSCTFCCDDIQLIKVGYRQPVFVLNMMMKLQRRWQVQRKIIWNTSTTKNKLLHTSSNVTRLTSNISQIQRKK